MKRAPGTATHRILIRSLILASISLVAAGQAGAHASSPGLMHSPLSGSVLVAQALRAGTLHVSGSGAAPGSPSAPLTCSPAPCRLPNVQASEGGQPVNEDPIVANPTNSQQLLTGGNDYNCPSLQGFYASSDGGGTWNKTCLNTVSGSFGDGDPIVGYDLNGTAYIGGIDSPAGIVMEKSTNNGTTWSAPGVAVRPVFSGGLTDKPWMQIDTNAASPHANSIYISVTQFNASEQNELISVSHSSDGGATWTTKVVDTQQVFPKVDQFSDLAIGKDGTVYVTWMRCSATGSTGDCGGTTATFLISKSTDGGNTWSSPVTVATATLAPDPGACCFYGVLPNTGERVSDIPAVDIDNSNGAHAGNLYVVMYNWTGSFLQVEVATSSDGGATWGAPVAVAAPSVTHDQFFPWLTVSRAGLVGVTWLDRRNDPSNVKYQAFAAFSNNGATSFSRNIPLATVLSNPNNDGFGGTFMGDYTGNYWSTPLNLVASWMDSRNGVNMQDEVGGFLL